jgi:hypothetical protein
MGDDDNNEMGSAFINPIIIIPKGDVLKLVLDARYLNSQTDLTQYSWPLEPVNVLITKIRGKYFTISDMSCAYHQVPLTPETMKLVSFVIGDHQWMFLKGFYGLCGLPNYFSRIMVIIFAPMIKAKEAMTYIDDLLIQAFEKEHMFNLIKKVHTLLRKANLKAAPDKTFFFLRNVKFLGHMISERGISPVNKRVTDLKALKSPENKLDIMKVLGCLNFYSRYVRNMGVIAKPLYDLSKNEGKFEWLPIHEKAFQDMKDGLSKDTILAIPNTSKPFHIHVDASLYGIGCILIQEESKDEKRIVSYNSRIFTPAEQKMATIHRELCGIIFALDTYEYLIIGSPFDIVVFTDHKPILFLFSKKGNLNARFFKYQLTLTKFQNLKIVWTPGKSLSLPDLLSRNQTLANIRELQSQHHMLPQELAFYKDEKQVHYIIQHDEPRTDKDCEDSYPIIADTDGVKEYFRIEGFPKTGAYAKVKIEEPKTLANCVHISYLFVAQKELSMQKEEKRVSQILKFETTETKPITEEIGINIRYAKILYESVEAETGISTIQEQQMEMQWDKITNWRKMSNLTLEVIKVEQEEDIVLGEVLKWIRNPSLSREGILTQQSKPLAAYAKMFELLSIDESTQILCKKEETSEDRKICLPISLMMLAYWKAHTPGGSGHYGN